MTQWILNLALTGVIASGIVLMAVPQQIVLFCAVVCLALAILMVLKEENP